MLAGSIAPPARFGESLAISPAHPLGEWEGHEPRRSYAFYS
jgi:hypothetical protein